FHLVTHAFFKALLFLGAGSVIHALHHAYHATHSREDAQDMRNMGGLARHLPWTSTLMWVATLAIAGIPPFAGFFSKDQILSAAFSLGDVHPLWYVYWLLGLLTALLTAFYMTRLMLYTFHGPNRTGERESAHLHEAPWVMTGPLVVLAALSLAGGALNVPALLRGREWLEHWLEPVTAVAARLRPRIEVPHGTEWALVIAAVAAGWVGSRLQTGQLGFSVVLFVGGVLAVLWTAVR